MSIKSMLDYIKSFPNIRITSGSSSWRVDYISPYSNAPVAFVRFGEAPSGGISIQVGGTTHRYEKRGYGTFLRALITKGAKIGGFKSVIHSGVISRGQNLASTRIVRKLGFIQNPRFKNTDYHSYSIFKFRNGGIMKVNNAINKFKNNKQKPITPIKNRTASNMTNINSIKRVHSISNNNNSPMNSSVHMQQYPKNDLHGAIEWMREYLKRQKNIAIRRHHADNAFLISLRDSSDLDSMIGVECIGRTIVFRSFTAGSKILTLLNIIKEAAKLGRFTRIESTQVSDNKNSINALRRSNFKVNRPKKSIHNFLTVTSTLNI